MNAIFLHGFITSTMIKNPWKDVKKEAKKENGRLTHIVQSPIYI